jgi:hypothetical protein
MCVGTSKLSSPMNCLPTYGLWADRFSNESVGILMQHEVMTAALDAFASWLYADLVRSTTFGTPVVVIDLCLRFSSLKVEHLDAQRHLLHSTAQ